jgi:hypothetical protein
MRAAQAPPTEYDWVTGHGGDRPNSLGLAATTCHILHLCLRSWYRWKADILRRAAMLINRAAYVEFTN